MQVEPCFLKLELLRTFWKQYRVKVHSDAIWIDVLEIVIAEKNMKWRWLQAAFWRYLKWCFWSCKLPVNFESKDAKRWLLDQFEALIWKLNLLRIFWKQGCILMQLESMFLKLELLRTFWKQKLFMVHSDAIWIDDLEVWTNKKVLKSTMLNVAFIRCRRCRKKNINCIRISILKVWK